MNVKQYIEEKLEDFEFYLRYELTDRIPQNILFFTLVGILNVIMITIMLYDYSTVWSYFYLTIPVTILLVSFSIWNTINFFNQGKSYQLLHAAVDEKKQSIFQPIVVKYGTEQNPTPPPLLSDQYKLNKYPLKTTSSNLHISSLDRPPVIRNYDTDQATAKQREGPVILEVLKTIFFV
jgi:hypothetical protein